jgi:phosphatidylinositol alpha 1,6-mannosyltransferase
LSGSLWRVRVAIVAESFLPSVNGVTNSVLRVLQHLERSGHRALVLAAGDPPASVHGAHVVGIPSLPLPTYTDFRLGMPTSRFIARVLNTFGPDVVHLASPFTTGAPALRAAARCGVPAVAVYQTDVAGFATHYPLAAAAADLAWRRIRSIHNRSDLTLAPSRTSAAALAEHGIDRVRLWPRGVDTAAFGPQHYDHELRRRLAPDGEVIVGFLGRLALEKRIDDLATLHDQLGVRLVLIGDGPDRERLQRLLPRARFLGMLHGVALSRAVATLDVGVQTGPHETFCQSAQEMMASAVPVVGVGAGAVAELVTSSHTGWLYPPGDLDALRQGVLDLAGDRAKRRAMGRAAQEAVRGRTWPVVCEQLMDHYALAIARHQELSATRP